MSKTYTAREVGIAIFAAVEQKVNAMAADLARVQKAEAEGLAQLQQRAVQKGERKSVFAVLKKAETFISNDHPAEPGKRDVTTGKPGPNLPHDRKEKSISASGSGGEMKKGLGDPTKAPAPAKPPTVPQAAAPKPTGVPSAAKPSAAPTIPKPPKAPGAAGMTTKCEKGVFAALKNMKKGY